MHSFHTHLFALACLASISILPVRSDKVRPETCFLLVSPPALALLPGETIQQVGCDIRYGKFEALNLIPTDWTIHRSETSPIAYELSLQAAHFSNGLCKLEDLEGFLLIEAEMTPDFNLAITLHIVSNDPEPVGRELLFTKKNLVLHVLQQDPRPVLLRSSLILPGRPAWLDVPLPPDREVEK